MADVCAVALCMYGIEYGLFSEVFGHTDAVYCP